jgi:hypothetical protein
VLATVEEAVGAASVSGTVVAVMLLEAADAEEVPYEFVPVTVNVYATADCRPNTEIGDEAPVPVKPPGEDVTVYEVAALVVSGVNVISARPLLNGRFAPTFVAVPIVGAYGIKKSFAP